MSKHKRRGSVGRFFRRLALLVMTTVVLLALAGYTFLGTVLEGPSQIARDQLTKVLMEDPATDWIPGLYLDGETIAGICE